MLNKLMMWIKTYDLILSCIITKLIMLKLLLKYIIELTYANKQSHGSRLIFKRLKKKLVFFTEFQQIRLDKKQSNIHSITINTNKILTNQLNSNIS